MKQLWFNGDPHRRWHLSCHTWWISWWSPMRTWWARPVSRGRWREWLSTSQKSWGVSWSYQLNFPNDMSRDFQLKQKLSVHSCEDSTASKGFWFRESNDSGPYSIDGLKNKTLQTSTKENIRPRMSMLHQIWYSYLCVQAWILVRSWKATLKFGDAGATTIQQGCDCIFHPR